MKTITLYGIPNCDVVKKTLNWFKQRPATVVFHDFRKDGISKDLLKAWSAASGWETLLNKKSTTWRELSATQQEKVTDEAAAIELMLENPTLIKRPVIDFGKDITVGYNEAQFLNHLK